MSGFVELGINTEKMKLKYYGFKDLEQLTQNKPIKIIWFCIHLC